MTMATTMSRAELIALAAPACSVCGQPIVSCEQSWEPNGDGDWVPRKWFLVCLNGHRKQVEHP